MKVILLGSTGLIGKNCLKFLSNDIAVDKVTALVRKKTDVNLLKAEEVVFDYDNAEKQQEIIVGDVLVCCLGTTIKKAKSKEAFKKVDLEYPVKMAKIASQNGIKHLIVISSIGADVNGSTFYLKVKGEMEEQIKKIPFQTISILRPSILFGDRDEFRLGEKIGIGFMKLTGPLFFGKFSKYQGIEAETIAIAINKLIKRPHNTIEVFESDEIKTLAGS
jgi:uncharacterized protein YbjT (DUF2867 family)